MNVNRYLEHIGVNPGDVTVDEAGLRLLQRQHMLSVPFENLDIHWHRPIVLDTLRCFEKIVDHGRGGFCYELNGAFSELLTALGFNARLVSARVARGDGDYTPDLAHAAIIVTFEKDEFLADVGFGDFIFEPLRVVEGLEQDDREGIFRLDAAGADSFIVSKKVDDAWRPQNMFGLKGRSLDEFAGMCKFFQTSPESHFVKNTICSRLTPEGRKTLTADKFIVTARGERTEEPVASPAEFDRLLLEHFGIAAEHGLSHGGR